MAQQTQQNAPHRPHSDEQPSRSVSQQPQSSEQPSRSTGHQPRSSEQPSSGDHQPSPVRHQSSPAKRQSSPSGNQPSSGKHRPSPAKRRKIIIDVLLGLSVIALLTSEHLRPVFHRWEAIAFIALIAVHLWQHRNWFKALPRGAWPLKRKVSAAISLIPGALTAIVVALGYLVPRSMAAYAAQGFFGIAQVHHVLGYGLAVLFFAHALCHARRNIHKHKR